MGQRPTKQLEDRLGAIDARLKDLADSYGLANAPEIRDERERRLEAVRERSQARRAAGPGLT